MRVTALSLVPLGVFPVQHTTSPQWSTTLLQEGDEELIDEGEDLGEDLGAAAHQQYRRAEMRRQEEMTNEEIEEMARRYQERAQQGMDVELEDADTGKNGTKAGSGCKAVKATQGTAQLNQKECVCQAKTDVQHSRGTSAAWPSCKLNAWAVTLRPTCKRLLTVAMPETAGAVGQQGLLPTRQDPKLWIVEVRTGSEREAVVCLLQKAYDMQAAGTPLYIKSVFCHDHLKVGIGRLHGTGTRASMCSCSWHVVSISSHVVGNPCHDLPC